jgi:hypothetical protein
MYASNACASSAAYDFRKDFDGIARPAMIRYLKHLGYDPDEPSDGFDDCGDAASKYANTLWKSLRWAQRFPSLTHGITTWSRESAVEFTNTRLDWMIESDVPDEPIDVYRAVHLGTEMAREQGYACEPEAIDYAADRLRSKIERDAVENGEVCVHDGILTYYQWMKPQAERRRAAGLGDGTVVYVDWRKRKAEKRAAQEQAEARPSESEERQQQRKPGAEARSARPEKPLGSPTPFVWQKPKRREWLHANHYIRKYVTATVAPGGVGKSSNAIVEALAMVTGRGLPHALFHFGDKPPWRPLRVWYVNGEDPLDEVHLRFAAAMQHFGVTPEDVAGRLFVDTGREKDFVFARDNGKSVALAVPLVDSVVAGIRENGIDVLILDPFVAFHLLPESDNTKVNQVVRQFAEIADETNASVELVSHTRKTNGNEVGGEDARGAKALIDGARSGRTVNPMTEQEGEKAGLGPGEFMSIFRLDNGKPNMVKRVSGSTWRLMASVMVECEDGGTEDVGVCDAWSWPSKEEAAAAKDEVERKRLTPEKTDAIIAALADAFNKRRADKQSPQWAGYTVMPLIGLDIADKDDKNQMDAWLKLLVGSGDLQIETGERSNRLPCKYITISEKTRRRLDAASEK